MFIEHEEVLAVALEDVAPSLTYSSYEIKAALASGWGWSSTTKAFCVLDLLQSASQGG